MDKNRVAVWITGICCAFILGFATIIATYNYAVTKAYVAAGYQEVTVAGQAGTVWQKR